MDLSFQLYSARKFALGPTLSTLADLGYKSVEGYGGLDASSSSGLGGLYANLSELKGLLDGNGLSMPTAHVSLDLLEQPDRALEVAQTLGIQVIICPWISPDLRSTTRDGWQHFGDRLARVSEPFTKAGLTFGYHNHDFEFQPLPDGAYPMDVLLAAAPDLKAEADVAWIVRGKADPTPWLEQNGERLIAVHVKDIAPQGENADEDGWADVGHGTIAWKDLLRTIRTKTAAQYFVAEHDNPSDIVRFASRSIESVKSFGA
jgi:sugar phosphate isomerase/epimerase